MAMLACGQSHQAREVQAAIRASRALRAKGTYTVSLRSALYSQLPLSAARQDLAQDLRLLLMAAIDKGASRGLYAYQPSMGGEESGDLSNSQYGVLGVWYAADAGLEVPLAYWQRVESVWQEAQNDDGGWGYRPRDGRSYQSMTLAGLTTLVIAQDYLLSATYQPPGRRRDNVSQRNALDWLGKNFAVSHNPGRDTATVRAAGPNDPSGALGLAEAILSRQDAFDSGTFVHYMLFGMERLGEATGLTHFGPHAWYSRGADYLLRTQQPDGSWQGTFGKPVDTSFALLFLARGRAPVAIQRLQVGEFAANRPRDAAAVIRWLRRQTERHMNWQQLSPDAPAADWRQSPILLLASHQEVPLTPDHQAALKRYIDEGGTLLAVAEGDTPHRFNQWLAQLAATLYPQYSMRELSKDHPLFTANFPAADYPGKVMAMSNGVRELIIHAPDSDLTWRWQSSAGRTRGDAPHLGLVGNLHLIVTERANPRLKGDDWFAEFDTARPGPQNRWPVSRIRFGGNWDAESAGWANLAARLHNDGTAAVAAEPCSPEELNPTRASVAHLSSTHGFTPSPVQQSALTAYVDAGGTLLFDATGGDTAAAQSVRRLADTLFPSATRNTVTDLPDTQHKLTWRSAAGDGTVSTYTQNGRIVAWVIEGDLSAALVGYARESIQGLTPASAETLVRYILRTAYTPPAPR
jgi:hypothetical protein